MRVNTCRPRCSRYDIHPRQFDFRHRTPRLHQPVRYRTTGTAPPLVFEMAWGLGRMTE
jgi:hypothetical protein